MLLYLTVRDSLDMTRGVVRLRLDWSRMSWALDQDKHLAWLRLTNSRFGAFEARDNGVLWFWDQFGSTNRRNTLILHDPPKGAGDLNRHAGKGFVFDPRDAVFKGGRVDWSTDKAKVKSTLTPIRQAILDLLAANLPAFPADPKEPPNIVADKSGSDYAGVTNCGALPGWVVNHIPGVRGLVPEKMFVSWKMKDKEGVEVTKSGHAHIGGPMTAWEQFAKYLEGQRKLPGHFWIPYKKGNAKRPKPGDIYTLAKGSGPNAEFSHVGIVVDARGTNWRTADAGQGGGFAVGYRTRVWDANAGTLTLLLSGGSKLPPDLGTRNLRGWVDVDHMFAGWKGR